MTATDREVYAAIHGGRFQPPEERALRALYDLLVARFSDEAYDSTTWNESLDAATKNAIRDELFPVLGEMYQEGMGFKTADTATVNLGTVASGSVSDTETVNEVYHQITEIAGGAGGFDIEYAFTLDNAPGELEFEGRYQGNTGHTKIVQAWNYSLSQWDRFTAAADDMIHSTEDAEFTFPYEDLAGASSDYIDGTDSKIRIFHDTPGTGGHNLYLDHIVIWEKQYVVSTPGTFLVMDGWTLGENQGVTMDATSGAMTIVKTGTYNVALSHFAFSGSHNITFEVHLFVDGSRVSKAGFFRTLPEGAGFGVGAFGCKLAVTAGEVLDIRLTSLEGGVYITVESANFNIERIIGL